MKISRDKNGNKVLKLAGHKAIQTNGVMPNMHRLDKGTYELCDLTDAQLQEVSDYHKSLKK